MSTVKQLEQNIEESISLKYIADAYTEISSAKLKKIRAGIEKNRGFSQEIVKVLSVVKDAAAKRHLNTKVLRQGTISIVLTSNYRFTGNLEHQLVRFFMVETAKTKTDRMVVGKIGQEYLRHFGYFNSFETVTFKKDIPNNQELSALSAKLDKYQQILVYHAKMKSVLVQTPTVIDITQKPKEETPLDKKKYLDYIFEPEIEKIIGFFEKQITQLLFEQTFLESELARTAARLISMDSAQINANSYIHKQRVLLGQARQSQINMQLLETASSLLKWRKEMSEEGLR